MTDELSDAIAKNAAGPSSVSSDGVTVQQHTLADQIAADKYLSGKKAATNPVKGFTRVKIVSPGAV